MVLISGFSRRLPPALAALLFLAGCAGFPFEEQPSLPFKECSKSFAETLKTLVLGVTESSLTFIQKVLPKDMQWYEVVGGKDEVSGLHEIGHIKKYPGPPLNEFREESTTQFIVAGEVSPDQSDDRVVWLKRIDTILDSRSYRPLREEHRYRRFVVRNSLRGNCVTSVRPHPGDKAWISPGEFQALTRKIPDAKLAN